MRALRESGIQRLRGLKNLAWLSARQLTRPAAALVVSRVERRGFISIENHSPESVHILLSGVARITCRNRKGNLTAAVMVAPGMIPAFPPPVSGINYDFRCAAGTAKSEPSRWKR
jgi:hypothetical protein